MNAIPALLGAGLAALVFFASAKKSSGGKRSPTPVGEQVQKLLAEPHTTAELQTAADMLDRAGFKKEAADVRARVKPRIKLPGLKGAA